METLLLLLFFLLSDKNEGMKQTLDQFLAFYKENRELVKMLAGSLARPDGDKERGREQTESRPREEIGDLNILEEYLRRANA